MARFLIDLLFTVTMAVLGVCQRSIRLGLKMIATPQSSDVENLPEDVPHSSDVEDFPEGMSHSSDVDDLPEGIIKLSDSIYQLYSPDGEPEMEIIFFHGCQLDDYRGALWKTWLAEDRDDLIWPQAWLNKKIPNARILSVSYDRSAHCGQVHMNELGQNLFLDIILSSTIGQHCPVCLVGHGFGGMILKQFIVYADDQLQDLQQLEERREVKIQNFLQNVKGVVYFSTPHLGSPIADLVNNHEIVQKSVFAGFLEVLGAESTMINQKFRYLRTNLGIRSFGFGEGLPTKFKGVPSMVIAPEASSRYDTDSYWCSSKKDHYTLCRAKHEADLVIGKLTAFISYLIPSITTV